MSFFLGSWGMNRSAEQTNRPRTASRFTHSLNGLNKTFCNTCITMLMLILQTEIFPIPVPVESTTTQTSAVTGSGECLKLLPLKYEYLGSVHITTTLSQNLRWCREFPESMQHQSLQFLNRFCY